jgi:hypothetical protein
MSVWWEQIFNTEGASITEADLNVGTGTTAGSYSPSKSARLKAVKVIAGYQAATSLVEAGHIRLSSVSFGGVDLVVPFQGNGLHTAAADGNPELLNMSECDLPVTAGTPVAGKYMFIDTPTTPTIQVFAKFEG